MSSRTIPYLLAVIGVILFLWVALDFGFYQDDAYISFRYVANYLDGHGLVFNAGERVEGYTNFGWILSLILVGLAGLDYIAIARILGLAAGSGLILLAALFLRRLRNDIPAWYALVPIALVTANPSLAYWSQSGLETSLFAFATGLSLYLFLQRSRLLPAALTVLVLIRPEGALVAGILIFTELILDRGRPRYSLTSVGLALLLSLPFVGFKLLYYGSILPNPFYAKTGFDTAQLQAGWEYAVRFFTDYPYYLVGLILTPVLWKIIPRAGRVVWLFSLTYIVYIIIVGGDVLMVHRFFLAVLLPLALSLALVVWVLLQRVASPFRTAVVLVLTAGLAWLTVELPADYINSYERRERGLTHKMTFLADRLKATDPTDFSVAASTIGALSYHLRGHDVIDLLGLTDSTIARHPEPAIPGLVSTWRERGYNTPYVLGRAPDYIAFSTGVKPSAPAERALVLYPQFQECYRAISWHYEPPPDLGQPVGFPTFQRRCELTPPFVPAYSVNLVNNYYDGVNARTAGDFRRALAHLDRAISLAGERPYVYLLYFKALTLLQMGHYAEGHRLQNYIVSIDSGMYEPQADLYVYEFATGHLEKAAQHRRWLERLMPWEVERYDSLAEIRAKQLQSRRDRRGRN